MALLVEAKQPNAVQVKWNTSSVVLTRHAEPIRSSRYAEDMILATCQFDPADCSVQPACKRNWRLHWPALVASFFSSFPPLGVVCPSGSPLVFGLLPNSVERQGGWMRISSDDDE